MGICMHMWMTIYAFAHVYMGKGLESLAKRGCYALFWKKTLEIGLHIWNSQALNPVGTSKMCLMGVGERCTTYDLGGLRGGWDDLVAPSRNSQSDGECGHLLSVPCGGLLASEACMCVKIVKQSWEGSEDPACAHSLCVHV